MVRLQRHKSECPQHQFYWAIALGALSDSRWPIREKSKRSECFVLMRRGNSFCNSTSSNDEGWHMHRFTFAMCHSELTPNRIVRSSAIFCKSLKYYILFGILNVFPHTIFQMTCRTKRKNKVNFVFFSFVRLITPKASEMDSEWIYFIHVFLSIH